MYLQISPEQVGFMPSRGTREQIMNIRQMTEKFYEYDVPAYFCFLDCTKAFDTVQWEHLLHTLREMRTPEHLVRLINNLYIANRSYVRIEDTISNHFKVSKGLCEGCVFWIIRKATEGWEGRAVIGGR
jgi:hypothetical protein